MNLYQTIGILVALPGATVAVLELLRRIRKR